MVTKREINRSNTSVRMDRRLLYPSPITLVERQKQVMSRALPPDFLTALEPRFLHLLDYPLLRLPPLPLTLLDRTGRNAGTVPPLVL